MPEGKELTHLVVCQAHEYKSLYPSDLIAMGNVLYVKPILEGFGLLLYFSREVLTQTNFFVGTCPRYMRAGFEIPYFQYTRLPPGR